ncbi:MAG: YciI family protein [Flavobacteriales bacterium]|nr:YciI family protein [Flavobacteriales bacterium]
MKEFLLIVRTEGSVWKDLSPEQLQRHMEHGSAYIGNLVKEGKLKNANPVEDKNSRLVRPEDGVLKDGPFNESKEVLAGYFHISAKSMEEAVQIAKSNPIFDDIPSQIEIHSLMPIGGN